ncbi:WD40 repeat-like protein [Athelia psychrophila]|uniref:WD40 repeat-like protein n=1 Tax=Athelia psychrophila TaxID=1759441 RepID=A0A166N0J8_9AGAM|nr:WD40 repeat-like protein [Fibularhizoctonia sp. CBS 109695]
MRAQHTAHSLPAFPVYSAAFLSNNELILGGGGGASRSGIKNKLRFYRVTDARTIDLVDEHELEKGEDAPMSMAAYPNSRQFVCGINSTEDKLASGQNENCRVFAATEDKLELVQTRGTLTVAAETDDYQKVTALSPAGNLLAVAGSRDLSLLVYPSLAPAGAAIRTEHEIYDATFSATDLVVVTTRNLLVYALPVSEKANETTVNAPPLKLRQTVNIPELPGRIAGGSFRATRFHPQVATTAYSIINTNPPRTRQKSSSKPSFVVMWNITPGSKDESEATWEISKIKKVGDKSITCFDISSDGRFLAFGSSDYTIGMLDATTLAPLVTILKAHEFPPTTLRFNPSATLLVSGSADNSIRIIGVPTGLGGEYSWTTLFIMLLTLLVIMFAIAYQMAQ